MKTISIPTNDRLAHLERVLASLKAATGIDGWTLVFSCEPVASVWKAVTAIDWAPIYVQRNPVKMGCWSNTFRAAELAMTVGSRFNLYLEDDTVVSKDALTLADQFRESAFPVLALRRPEAELRPLPQAASVFNGGLFGDGFAWRSELWPVVRECWFARSRAGFSMWDWSMEDGLKARGVAQLRPFVNRSQNIGVVGTHQRGYDPNRHSECYGGPPVNQFQFQP